MAEPLRHRQTKGAETDMPGLQPLRHTSTLPTAVVRPEAKIPPRGACPPTRCRSCNRPWIVVLQPQGVGIWGGDSELGER
jgi:hypothetical protein